MRALQLLEYPSIPEIISASCISPRLSLLNGLSYQKLYFELSALHANRLVCRVSSQTGHQLRFCRDPSVFHSIRKIVHPIPHLTTCESCGLTCISYLGAIYGIRTDNKCPVCSSIVDPELYILRDYYFGRTYVIHKNIILGVLDYFSLRLPGSIRGYGTEYKRAIELLRNETGNEVLLAVVGHVS